MKTGIFTPCLSSFYCFPRTLLAAFTATVLFFSAQEAQAQCGAGWNYAKVNWDNLDYLITTGNYTGFVSAAMSNNQYFALGRTRVGINVPVITKNGENASHTGEAGSFGVGQDVQYTGNGVITLTFDTAVMNVKFSLYDIDALQSANVTAKDPLGASLNVTMAAVSGANPVVVGSGGISPTGTAVAGNIASNLNTASLNITVPGNANGVKSITITLAGNAGDFWLSDITACVYGSFPTNYYAIAQPFTGQPAYTLATPDSNTVSMINLSNGRARNVFRDAASNPYVNGLGYDPHNHNLYFVQDFTASSSSNKTLKKYDFNTETISVVLADITTLGIPTFNRGVESAGSCFYDSCLYFGIEGTNSGANSNRETITWRISFTAGVPTGIAQVFALPSDNGSGTILKDWGDFNINNGILYDFNSGNGGSNSGFFHYDLQTDSIINTYVTGPALIARQSALRWDGQLYWLYDSIATYSAGTVGPRTKIVGATRLDWVGFSGDASDPFKPKSDFGDAPASYDPDPMAPATHEWDSTLILGPTFDREWSKVSTVGASGDGSDEDGILGPLPIFTHSQSFFNIIVRVLNKSGANATLGGWLDFNNNGVFDAGEGVTVNVASSPSLQNITLSWAHAPISTSMANIYARIRLTSASNGMTAANSTGWYSNGEVEDYLLLVDDVLPVRLVDFTAKSVSASTVQLNWTVTDEVNLQDYQVQRSVNGTSWESIATVNPKNTAGLKLDYSQLDKQPYSGTSYYRLQMTDTKGKITYSTIRKVDLVAALNGRLIHPNPFVNSFSVDVQLVNGGDVELRILDYSGKLLQSRVYKAKAGANSFVIDGLGNLPKGYYLAELVQDGQKVFQEKVSRQ